MNKGGWKKKKEIYRKVIADIDRAFPRFTRNWQKLHPDFLRKIGNIKEAYYGFNSGISTIQG